MKHRSFLLVSTMILVAALAACTAQPTPTATSTQAAPAATDMSTAMSTVAAMSTDTMPAATQAAGATAPASGSPVKVDIANFAFAPTTLTVKVGTTVTWTNQDSAAHTVTSDTGLFDSGNMPQGKTFSYTFTSAGTYAYHCTYHAMMKATVVVTQ